MNLSEIVCCEDTASVDNKIDLERMMRRLTPQEAAVLSFWIRGDTQESMARELRVSTRRIRQITAKVWQKLPLLR